MIISQQKPFEEIVHILGKKKRVFIIGCGLCATLCQSGGEEQVKEMKERLIAEGKEISGHVVIEAVCHILVSKKALALHKAELKESEAILVMACGAGVQTITELKKTMVVAALDTLFVGNVIRFGQFEERCSLCGDCILNKTGGICPVTSCAKGLLNGPCGGMHDGKCEIDPERDCAWVKIYEKLEESGELENIEEIFDPKDYSRTIQPKMLILEKGKKRL
ncbi:MAG: methylenetetrahydrofolate reductase C-terminal domain-containing protein [Deltaproteobacteria bacterium]|nr:methylenetetrahydrofolate reductase C-terminal domain-containing protein [Deltaproteobacteria bacterium]